MKFRCKTTGKIISWEPIMINASLVSAQNRKRLFWVGKLADKRHIGHWDSADYEKVNISQPHDEGILLKDILEDNANESYSVYNNKITVGKATTLGSNSQCFTAKTGQGIIRVGQIGKGGQGDRIYSPDGKSVGLSALGGGRGAKTGLYAVEDKSYCVPSTCYKENVKSLIQRKKKGLMVNENTTIRKLTPIECERLQSLPDNYTEGISNTQRYKTLGNGFNCAVIKHIIKSIL